MCPKMKNRKIADTYKKKTKINRKMLGKVKEKTASGDIFSETKEYMKAGEQKWVVENNFADVPFDSYKKCCPYLCFA